MFQAFILSCHSTSFPWKLVWRLKVPPRVAFCPWAVSLGKILSFENLRKRGIIILDWCCMCKRCGESVDYLLHHCPMAYELWAMAFYLFRLPEYTPSPGVLSFFFSINSFVTCKKKKTTYIDNNFYLCIFNRFWGGWSI